jgi:hypothetical protein
MLDMTNYRPISLLTTFAKILETVVIKTRLLNHLTKFNILTKNNLDLELNLLHILSPTKF